MQKRHGNLWKISLGRQRWIDHCCQKKSELKKTDIFDLKKIETEFYWFFTNVDPILANQIPESKNTFESCLVKTAATM